MSQSESLPIADGAIIERVVLVDRLERPESTRFESYSLPGHTVQMMVSGRVRQESDGRTHDIEPGLAIWYYDNELVKSEIVEPPWVYYTVNFVARTLSPPPFDQRVKPVEDEVQRAFERLLEAWRDASVPSVIRHMHIHARLLDVLAEVLPSAGRSFRMDPTTRLWWDIEAQIRSDLSQPISLTTIQKLTCRSLRTIIRSCHYAVGMAPMQRVKQMRLGMGRGLVVYSDLPFSEIARRVGYGRVQEFSRDYHKEFGVTPTNDRMAGPDYRLGRSHPQHPRRTPPEAEH